jgi:hypothetical protein
MKVKELTDNQSFFVGKLVPGADDEKYTFSLQPMNENHPLDYVTKFKGTIDEMIAECRRIINGLDKVLVGGSFTVKVSPEFFDNEWLISDSHIYNQDFEEIG